VHRPRPAELVREREHRLRRRVEGSRRQEVEPDTGAEVVGTEVSVEDEHRDQGRGYRGGHPPERAARDQVAQTCGNTVSVEECERTANVNAIARLSKFVRCHQVPLPKLAPLRIETRSVPGQIMLAVHFLSRR
jgi:hypothetical protein